MLRRIFASFIIILIALALPVSALAQDYYFGVEEETVHVYWNENGTLSLEGDAAEDFTTWDHTTTRLMAGGEFLIADHYPVRAGYRWDSGLQAHAASAGIGYISSVFSLEFGARRIIGEYAATALVFSFAYHVESSGVSSTEY